MGGVGSKNDIIGLIQGKGIFSIQGQDYVYLNRKHEAHQFIELLFLTITSVRSSAETLRDEHDNSVSNQTLPSCHDQLIQIETGEILRQNLNYNVTLSVVRTQKSID